MVSWSHLHPPQPNARRRRISQQQQQQQQQRFLVVITMITADQLKQILAETLSPYAEIRRAGMFLCVMKEENVIDNIPLTFISTSILSLPQRRKA
jgi:hypothetical protein